MYDNMIEDMSQDISMNMYCRRYKLTCPILIITY